MPGFADEIADFLAADAEFESSASTSDAVTAPVLRMHEVDAEVMPLLSALGHLMPIADNEPTVFSSTVAAAKKRERGPTLTEQRFRLAADAEKAEESRRAKQRCGGSRGGGGGGGAKSSMASSMAAAVAAALPAGDQSGQRRGRARLNAPLATGSAAAAGSEFAGRTRGLEAAGEFRRSKSMRAVAPAGGANFRSAPVVRNTRLAWMAMIFLKSSCVGGSTATSMTYRCRGADA